MYKGIALTISLLFSTLAFGAPSRWYDNVQIQYIYAGAVGNRLAIKTNANIDVGECHAASELALDPNNPFFDQIFSIVLMAKASGKTVRVYTSGICSERGVSLDDISVE